MQEKQDNISAINRARMCLALLAVIMVIVGQTNLYTAIDRPNTGVPPYMWLSLAGVVIFVLSLTLPVPVFLQKLFANLPISKPGGWIIASVIFSALAAISMIWFEKRNTLSYLPVISLWFGSAACYVVAVTRVDLKALDWKKWLQDHKWELAAVGLITLLAAIPRLYNLGTIPRVLNGDEGWVGLMAQETGHAPLSNPFALWNNISALYLQLINLIFLLFGANAFSLRFLVAVGGTLAVPATYILAKQVAGKRVALITGAMLAYSHFHINFSRTAGSDYVFTTLFIPVILYLLLSAFEKRSPARAALAGVFLALFFCTNLMAQGFVGLLLITSLVMLLFRSWCESTKLELAVLWGGFFITVIPEGLYVWQHPNDFISRLSSSGTFQTGWLGQTAASTHQSIAIILAQRVVHAFLSLVYYPALDYYGVPIPPLTLISATLFLIGAGLCLYHTNQLKYLVLNIIFWGFTFIFGIFALPPSADTYRMLTVFPIAILSAAMGLDAILNAVGLAWDHNRTAYASITVLVLLSLIMTNLWTYFGEFAGRCLYADNTAGRFASYMGSYAATERPEDSIYLLSNDIYRYGTHPSTDFLSGKHPITNVPGPADSLTMRSSESIIASPDRIDELEAWAANHPGGQLQYTHDCSKVILVSYQIP